MKTLAPIAALLVSVFLLVSGNALISVVVPIRGNLSGFGDLTVGLLGSAYFVGMLVGTLKTPAVVRAVGHIRAFAAFVAVGAVAVDLMSVWVAPGPWFVSRALIGFVLAGIYAVIESWINAAATNANRGALYATYQIVNFAASANGQLLLRGLDPLSFTPYAIGSALLALAVVPLSVTSANAPDLPESVHLRLSWFRAMPPLSIAAAAIAGAANGASISLAPVYALQIGVSPSAAPIFTASIVVGSALGVFPVGRLSDRFNRPLIMATAMALGAIAEFSLAILNPTGLPLSALGFLVGVFTYTLYTLAVSIANDRAAPGEMVLVSASLLFVYCLAAIGAPALASVLMRATAPSALFWQNGLLHAGLAAFALAYAFSGGKNVRFRRR